MRAYVYIQPHTNHIHSFRASCVEFKPTIAIKSLCVSPWSPPSLVALQLVTCMCQLIHVRRTDGICAFVHSCIRTEAVGTLKVGPIICSATNNPLSKQPKLPYLHTNLNESFCVPELSSEISLISENTQLLARTYTHRSGDRNDDKCCWLFGRDKCAETNARMLVHWLGFSKSEPAGN